MALVLFQNPAESAAPALEPKAAKPSALEWPRSPTGEPINKVFERLEVELGAMVRKLEGEADVARPVAKGTTTKVDTVRQSPFYRLRR